MADTKKRSCCPFFSPITIIVALCGILLSTTVSLVVRSYTKSLDEAEFKQQITVFLAAVERRRRNTEDLLRTFRSLLAFHPNLTQEQFQTTFEDIIHRPDSAGSFVWAPLIPHANRASVEAKMLKLNTPYPEFTEGSISHGPTELVIRAANRPEYFPIRFIEPQAGQQHLVGLDLLQIPEIAETIEFVKTGGDIRVSPRINIRFEDHVQPGLVAVIPVYRPSLEPESEADRNSQFCGAALAILSLPKIMEGFQSAVSKLNLDVMWVDVLSPTNRSVLHSTFKNTHPQTLQNQLTETEFCTGPFIRQSIAISGRTWDLLFRRSSDWTIGPVTHMPAISLNIGLLFTALLTLYFATLQRNKARAEHLVTLRTAELASANAQLIEEITHRTQTEEARRELDRQLQETQKLESLGLLAGGIAHDFNNILTTIIGNAGLAKIDLPPNSPAPTSLKEIEQAAKHAADLCRQLLASAVIAKFKLRKLNLTHFVEKNMEFLQLSISKKISLKYRLQPNLPPTLADPTQLQQILMNLVINASEAMHDKVGTITIHTRLLQLTPELLNEIHPPNSLQPGPCLAIEIHDTGSGMPPDVLKRIFEPFYSTKFTGRGLGLAATLGMARSHNGALHVASQPNQGSQFTLLLPPTEGHADNDTSISTKPTQFKSHGTLLLVDDEAAVRKVAAKLLEKAGFNVHTAEDGASALHLFQQQPDTYRAVILDLTMPRMDGATAIKAIRKISSHTPLLMMSGYSEGDTVKLACSSPSTAFIQKPFGPDELLNTLQQLLESHPEKKTQSE
ncbi:MAG: hypothetical protein RI897_650 [Verrucomicrobiota bacterium]